MAQEIITLGSTQRFELEARLNGSAWDLTPATVTIYLQAPDGTEQGYVATVSDATGGIAYYDVAKTIFTAGGAGVWKRKWKVVDGTITQVSVPIPFKLIASLV